MEFHNPYPDTLHRRSTWRLAVSAESPKRHDSPLEVLKFLGCRYDGPDLDWVEGMEDSVRAMFWEVFEDDSYDEESKSSESDRVSISDEEEEEDGYFLCDHCFF